MINIDITGQHVTTGYIVRKDLDVKLAVYADRNNHRDALMMAIAIKMSQDFNIPENNHDESQDKEITTSIPTLAIFMGAKASHLCAHGFIEYNPRGSENDAKADAKVIVSRLSVGESILVNLKNVNHLQKQTYLRALLDEILEQDLSDFGFVSNEMDQIVPRKMGSQVSVVASSMLTLFTKAATNNIKIAYATNNPYGIGQEIAELAGTVLVGSLNCSKAIKNLRDISPDIVANQNKAYGIKALKPGIYYKFGTFHLQYDRDNKPKDQVSISYHDQRYPFMLESMEGVHDFNPEDPEDPEDYNGTRSERQTDFDKEIEENRKNKEEAETEAIAAKLGRSKVTAKAKTARTKAVKAKTGSKSKIASAANTVANDNNNVSFKLPVEEKQISIARLKLAGVGMQHQMLSYGLNILRMEHGNMNPIANFEMNGSEIAESIINDEKIQIAVKSAIAARKQGNSLKNSAYDFKAYSLMMYHALCEDENLAEHFHRDIREKNVTENLFNIQGRIPEGMSGEDQYHFFRSTWNAYKAAHARSLDRAA